MPQRRIKTIILTLLFSFIGITSYAQTHIKANCLYWLLAMPNISVETKLADHFTLSSEIFYSPWESIAGNSLKFLQFNPDVRWYPKGSFNGFYAGIYASIQDFKISKWNYWNHNQYQDGWGYSFGGMFGFQALLTNKWALDVNVGGGWHHGEYVGYYKDTGKKAVDKNASGEWIPYRLGIVVCYRL
jgi:hypothetical protein